MVIKRRYLVLWTVTTILLSVLVTSGLFRILISASPLQLLEYEDQKVLLLQNNRKERRISIVADDDGAELHVLGQNNNMVHLWSKGKNAEGVDLSGADGITRLSLYIDAIGRGVVSFKGEDGRRVELKVNSANLPQFDIYSDDGTLLRTLPISPNDVALQ